MRMWNIDPRIMCRQHLMGEHVEMHMFAGSIAKGTSMDGYIRNGLLDVGSIKARHDMLAEEMVRRGYNHKSPMPTEPEYLAHATAVDHDASLADLLNRCPDCRGLHEVFK